MAGRYTPELIRRDGHRKQ